MKLARVEGKDTAHGFGAAQRFGKETKPRRTYGKGSARGKEKAGKPKGPPRHRNLKDKLFQKVLWWKGIAVADPKAENRKQPRHHSGRGRLGPSLRGGANGATPCKRPGKRGGGLALPSLSRAPAKSEGRNSARERFTFSPPSQEWTENKVSK